MSRLSENKMDKTVTVAVVIAVIILSITAGLLIYNSIKTVCNPNLPPISTDMVKAVISSAIMLLTATVILLTIALLTATIITLIVIKSVT